MALWTQVLDGVNFVRGFDSISVLDEVDGKAITIPLTAIPLKQNRAYSHDLEGW
jgi:hypothetical protein